MSLFIWSAVAERSADTALDQTLNGSLRNFHSTQHHPKRCRRGALPAHSKLKLPSPRFGAAMLFSHSDAVILAAIL